MSALALGQAFHTDIGTEVLTMEARVETDLFRNGRHLSILAWGPSCIFHLQPVQDVMRLLARPNPRHAELHQLNMGSAFGQVLPAHQQNFLTSVGKEGQHQDMVGCAWHAIKLTRGLPYVAASMKAAVAARQMSIASDCEGGNVTLEGSAAAADLRLLVDRAGGAPWLAPALPLLAVLPLVRLAVPLVNPLSACNSAFAIDVDNILCSHTKGCAGILRKCTSTTYPL